MRKKNRREFYGIFAPLHQEDVSSWQDFSRFSFLDFNDTVEKVCLDLEELAVLDLVRVEVSSVLSVKSESFFDIGKDVRFQVEEDFGVMIPPLNFYLNFSLADAEFILKIKEHFVGKFQVYPEKMLVVGAEKILAYLSNNYLVGNYAEEPVFRRPALVLPIHQTLEHIARELGCMVYKEEAVMAYYLRNLLTACLYELIDTNQTALLLSRVHPEIKKDLQNLRISIFKVRKVLSSLLFEYFPIKRIEEILQVIINYGCLSADVLTEHVRLRLAENIVNNYTKRESAIIENQKVVKKKGAYFFSLENLLEEELLKHTELLPSQNLFLQKFITLLDNTYREFWKQSTASLILVTSSKLRHRLKNIRLILPSFQVFSEEETSASQLQHYKKIYLNEVN